MKKSIARGSIILIASGIVCKMLGAFFRLPLTNILGIEGIGVFQMVMAVYSFALVLTSGGVSSALSKFVSQSRALGDFKKVKNLFKTALIYSLILGISAGVLLMALAFPLSRLQGVVSARQSYFLMLILIPLGGVIASMRGLFQGYENMTPTAVSQILEQGVKFALGIFFAQFFAKQSLQAGVFGAFLGICFGEIIAIVFLGLYMKIKIKFDSDSQKFIKFNFIKAVVPLSVGSAVLPLSAVLDSLIVVSRLEVAGVSGTVATALFGLQTGVVGAILNLPLIFSSSISTAMLPSISFLDASFSQESEISVGNALKIMWFILVPMVVGIACVCKPLYSLIYPSLNAQTLIIASQLTYLGVVSTIITALMQFFVTLLQAKGEWNYILFSYIVGGIAKFICVFVLCAFADINIFGVAIGNITLSSIVCIMALVRNKKKISIDVFELSLPMLSAVAMMLVINLFISNFQFSLVFQLIFSVIIGVIVYLIFTLPLIVGIFKTIFAKKIRRGENEQNTIN